MYSLLVFVDDLWILWSPSSIVCCFFYLFNPTSEPCSIVTYRLVGENKKKTRRHIEQGNGNDLFIFSLITKEYIVCCRKNLKLLFGA